MILLQMSELHNLITTFSILVVLLGGELKRILKKILPNGKINFEIFLFTILDWIYFVYNFFLNINRINWFSANPSSQFQTSHLTTFSIDHKLPLNYLLFPPAMFYAKNCKLTSHLIQSIAPPDAKASLKRFNSCLE